jgi:hypothetical protein
MESSLREENKIREQIEQAMNIQMKTIETIMDAGIERISNRLEQSIRMVLRLHKARMGREISWTNAPKRMVM